MKEPNKERIPELSAEMIEIINRLLKEGKRLEIAAKPDGIRLWEIRNKRIEM
nr:MAG TPA: hypothetical protein [Caudoviricetes sp.]